MNLPNSKARCVQIRRAILDKFGRSRSLSVGTRQLQFTAQQEAVALAEKEKREAFHQLVGWSSIWEEMFENIGASRETFPAPDSSPSAELSTPVPDCPTPQKPMTHTYVVHFRNGTKLTVTSTAPTVEDFIAPPGNYRRGSTMYHTKLIFLEGETSFSWADVIAVQQKGAK